MTIARSTAISWLTNLKHDQVAIDDGGLTLVEVDSTGNATDNYLEVGGYGCDHSFNVSPHRCDDCGEDIKNV